MCGRFENDPYEILGVPHGSDAKAIKLAYRRQSLRHHPDKNPDNKEESEAIFKRLAWAYGILGDEERRAEFDRTGTTGDEDDPAAAFNIDKRFAGADFDLFFNMGDVGGISASSPTGPTFATGDPAVGVPRDRVPQAGTMGDALSPDSAEQAADIIRAQSQAQVQVRVGIRALFRGGQEVVQVNQWVACTECAGSGRTAMTGKPVCTTCYGGDPDCTVCGGSIEAFMMHTIGTSTVQCRACEGKGLARCRLKQVVQIPPGCPDGLVAEVQAREGPPVRVHYVVNLPTLFARRGSELCMTIHISVHEALSGFQRTLRLPSGTQVQLVVPGVVQPGCHWRVPRAGLPEYGGGDATGDIVLNFVVKWPNTPWERADYNKAGRVVDRQGGAISTAKGVEALTSIQASRWAHVLRCTSG